MKILVVDHVTLFQNIIEEVLRNTELSYEFVNTGKDTLEALKNTHYDMLCISMYLEDMDALELSQKIRAFDEYAYIPIILITSESSTNILKKVMQAGITDIFEKKDINEIVNFIQRFSRQQNKIKGRVLYIEDSLSQRQLVTSILESRGLLVDAFNTAEEAFEVFIKHDYDLVVTDIILDGVMNGLTLANKIRRLSDDKGDIPILAVTAFDNTSRRIGLFHLGINDYVIKPIVEEELCTRAKSLIENHQFILRMKREKNKALRDNEAKSEFLSITSHELKTPLNAVIGHTQLLQMDAEAQNLDNDFIESLSEIESASNHLLALINELLDLSSIEAGKMVTNLSHFDPEAVIYSAIDFIQYAASQRGLELHIDLLAHNIEVTADSGRLKQVIINLLSNAVKYNRENGEIFIKTAYIEHSKLLRISVRDTGYGLSEDDCKRIFEKFNRLGAEKGNIEGTGLGLYVAKKMIDEMSGLLDVKSCLGKGTQFSIFLPIKIDNV